MIMRLLKLAIVVLLVFAIIRSPSAAAHNVRVAGTAAVHILGTVADKAGEFIQALLTHK
ncbi:MAG TPA: hypothetical protein VII47_06360 [Actinomycetota bacterium]|jgi:hypothetical protein